MLELEDKRQGVQAACPRCGGGLNEGRERWSCRACREEFRALRGIPDLRVAEDEYLSAQNDWDRAIRLSEDFDRSTFAQLLDRYYEWDPETPPDLRRRQIDHIRSASGRAELWLSKMGGRPNSDHDLGFKPLLDLGCGSGSFLEAAAQSPSGSSTKDETDETKSESLSVRCWGLDIAMRWLILAQKRLDELGLSSRVRLVCGNAEHLPFADQSFGAVVAGDVIEHVRDQAVTLCESHRVLRPNGRLLMASPNRYSLAPEPHVQVWGVGYLPRAWMASYVKRMRGVDFRAIRTLGYREWKSLLRSSPFQNTFVEAPKLPDADFEHFGPVKGFLGHAYNRAVGSRWGQGAARRLGPLFHVVCVR